VICTYLRLLTPINGFFQEIKDCLFIEKGGTGNLLVAAGYQPVATVRARGTLAPPVPDGKLTLAAKLTLRQTKSRPKQTKK
jgi:hypothetical protein